MHIHRFGLKMFTVRLFLKTVTDVVTKCTLSGISDWSSFYYNKSKYINYVQYVLDALYSVHCP